MAKKTAKKKAPKRSSKNGTTTAKKKPAKKTAAKKKTVKKASPKKKAAKKKTKKASPKKRQKAQPDKVSVANDELEVDVEVPVDRRVAKESDRRTGEDRRQEVCEVDVDRRETSERRTKVARRRQIDPTTCERDYSNDEIEFMHALDEYKRRAGRMFPTCSEILEVVREIGYRRLTPEELALLGGDQDSNATDGDTTSGASELDGELTYPSEEVSPGGINADSIPATDGPVFPASMPNAVAQPGLNDLAYLDSGLNELES